MLVLHLVFVFLCSAVTLQDATQGLERELPAWTEAEPERDFFVVETEVFSTHFAATESLLPAVKTDVSNWAATNFGDDSLSIIASIPLEDFRSLVEEEVVHKFRRDYDEETAIRLEADHDDFYVGYVRVRIDSEFRDKFERRLTKLRLKNRLGTVLVAAIFCFGLLAIGWAYLFTSQLTRGFYISRLRWLAGLLVGVLVVMCYLVYQLAVRSY